MTDEVLMKILEMKQDTIDRMAQFDTSTSLAQWFRQLCKDDLFIHLDGHFPTVAIARIANRLGINVPEESMYP